jgi:hypothetical protein
LTFSKVSVARAGVAQASANIRERTGCFIDFSIAMYWEKARPLGRGKA